jgi:hypothetical protein
MKGYLLETDPEVPGLTWLWRRGSVNVGWEICYVRKRDTKWEPAVGPTHHAPWRRPGPKTIWKEPTREELFDIFL